MRIAQYTRTNPCILKDLLRASRLRFVVRFRRFHELSTTYPHHGDPDLTGRAFMLAEPLPKYKNRESGLCLSWLLAAAPRSARILNGQRKNRRSDPSVFMTAITSLVRQKTR